MSRYSPSVLPTYNAPNISQTITQALLQKQQMDRQRDLDAVNTGIGLQPVDPNAPPEHSALSRLAGAVYSRITGHANPNDVADANANLANYPAAGMIDETPNFATDESGTLRPSSRQAWDEQMPGGGRLPGAFDPMTGGFTPSQSNMMRLPSGQTIDMRYTPYGQRQEAREDTQAYNLNLRQMMIEAAMQRAESANQTREKIADDRNATTRDVAGQRITTQRELHNTPTGTAIYGAQHRAPRASAPRASAPPQPVQADDPKRSAYVLKRVVELTKPTKGLGGLSKPGLSLDEATRQANVEWSAAHGGPTSGATPHASAAPANQESSPAAQVEYNAAAQKYQHALSLGIDPALARDAYNTDVMAIAQKHGHQ